MKRWTESELDYLMNKWGNVSVKYIANKLDRSVDAIISKAQRLGLGAVLASGDYITLNQLSIALTGSPIHSYTLKSWVQNRGLPVHTRKVVNNSYRIVYIDEFWEWAEKNKAFIDFSRLEPLALGKEPEWVKEQRKKDFKACALQRKDPWTPYEDERLRFLLKQQKYSWCEISDMLNRSEGAIQRRCSDLKIKDRPIKADNHGPKSIWTDGMYGILADGIRNGDCYADIAKIIGKSEKAVRGKVYTTYFTENADKAREMMGDGDWGYGAPEPTVKQALYLAGYRKECREGLSAIVGLLKYRLNLMGYGDYWQREMCMKWDDFKGCGAGCANCDECIEFERIKPQYCARCGGEFYERQQNRFCRGCRNARKKNAQKRWCMKNKIER